MKPGPILADLPLIGHVRRSLHRASRVATISLRTHPAATTPVESSGALFARFPDDRSLPRFVAGSASTSALSGPARRSLIAAVCVLAKSPTVTLYIEGFSRFVNLHDCSDCYRLERQLPGGSSPLRNRAFSRRTTITAHQVCARHNSEHLRLVLVRRLKLVLAHHLRLVIIRHLRLAIVRCLRPMRS
jgi:hypothetical protein